MGISWYGEAPSGDRLVYRRWLNSRMLYSQKALMLGGYRNVDTKFNKRGGSHKE